MNNVTLVLGKEEKTFFSLLDFHQGIAEEALVAVMALEGSGNKNRVIDELMLEANDHYCSARSILLGMLQAAYDITPDDMKCQCKINDQDMGGALNIAMDSLSKQSISDQIPETFRHGFTIGYTSAIAMVIPDLISPDASMLENLIECIDKCKEITKSDVKQCKSELDEYVQKAKQRTNCKLIVSNKTYITADLLK